MAQLPPKVPAMAPAWPEFGDGHHHSAHAHARHHHHQRSPSMGAFLAAPMPPLPPANGGVQQQPSWVDEFLDFSAAKRGAHRRTVSDSVAFLDDGNAGGVGAHEFDRLDDDQLMCMFSDELAPQRQAASASSPSDHNSVNDEKQDRGDAEEAQSDCNGDDGAAPGQPSSPATADPKRVKRILANRQSAQRSRVRKLHYISELERSVTSLQTEVSALSPRVAFLDHQRSLLTLGNSHLKQRIAALAQDKIFKDAHQEALKKEIERLSQIYQQQQSLRDAQPPADGDGPPVRGDDNDGLIAGEGTAAAS
ncbi:basic leucine zipper 2-like [Triticum dicoccoides]|uniref:BZIP domain-containing protein n=1 Tax=Triticum aestivum TaxID=4565 RepID=A0A3B6ECV3_WHEAT|nr:basic leucine zipper 2-like [Triticum dicoccoides]XP_044336877.1 basic leucine zipper 2-like [Triticum aestivum]